MSEPLIFYSSSSTAVDEDCKRKRFYANEYAGCGITQNETSMPLFIGEVLHSGLAAIANGLPIDDIALAAEQEIKGTLLGAEYVSPDEENFANEQLTLVQGLLMGFYKHIWPQMMSQYEIVAIEGERIFRHDIEGKGDPNGRFVFMSKPDLLLRDKEGCLWYFEYKSTSSNKEQWTNSWRTAVQLHSGIRAVEQMLGEKVTGVIVQGLYKGYVASGKSTSPFCYAYHKAGEPPFTKERWSYTYAAGLKKYPVWEREGGIKRWVDEMPAAILGEQFPQVPPIFVNEELIDAFFRQRALRELQISNAKAVLDFDAETYASLMDEAFPQNFTKCNPSFGFSCSFSKICHGPAQSPEALGFKLRDNSHRDVFKELVQ